MLSATEHEVHLPRGIDAPRRARNLISERFGGQLARRELDTARLLTSELVTNAVVHGDGAITMHVDLDAHRLRIEVFDQGTGFERLAEEREVAPFGGLGLKLVDAEASRWGIRKGSTQVWFELDRLAAIRLRAVIGGTRRSL